MMGRRGPVPKRSEDRRRRNQPQGKQTRVAVENGKADQPQADNTWHPIAKRLWNSLGKSAQSIFYEPSDWAMAYSLCDDLSYYKSQERRSGQMLASIMSAMSNLLVTEGDRRRVQLELQRKASGPDETAKVTEMNQWKAKLS